MLGRIIASRATIIVVMSSQDHDDDAIMSNRVGSDEQHGEIAVAVVGSAGGARR